MNDNDEEFDVTTSTDIDFESVAGNISANIESKTYSIPDETWMDHVAKMLNISPQGLLFLLLFCLIIAGATIVMFCRYLICTFDSFYYKGNGTKDTGDDPSSNQNVTQSSAVDAPPAYTQSQQTFWWDEGQAGVGSPGFEDQPPPRYSTIISSQIP